MMHFDEISFLGLQVPIKKKESFNALAITNTVVNPLLRKMTQSNLKNPALATVRGFLLFGFMSDETRLKNMRMAV